MEETIVIKEYQKVILNIDVGERREYFVSRIMKHDDNTYHLRLTSTHPNRKEGDPILIVLEIEDEILTEKERYG